MGQKIISFIRPSIWKSLPDSIRKANNLNNFKHNVKKHYLTWTPPNVFMWICVSVFISVFILCVYVYACLRVCLYIYIYAYVLVCFPLTYQFSWFFFSFNLSSNLFSDLMDHKENKCYSSHCWCYLYLFAVIYQLQHLFINF